MIQNAWLKGLGLGLEKI